MNAFETIRNASSRDMDEGDAEVMCAVVDIAERIVDDLHRIANGMEKLQTLIKRNGT